MLQNITETELAVNAALWIADHPKFPDDPFFRYGVGQGDINGWANLSYMVADPLCLDFALGCLVALARRLVGRIVGSGPLLASGLLGAGILCAAMYVIPGPRLVSYGLPACALVELASVCVLPRGRTVDVLAYLGDASYAIYLVHIFVALGAARIAAASPLQADVTGILLTVIAVALGCLFHSCVERPMIGAPTPTRAVRRTSAAAAGAT